MRFNPNKYYTYGQMVELLKHFRENFGHLCELESIGKTHENRDIWLMTITLKESGDLARTHLEKPAYWIDGNLHASEVAGTQVSLCVIDRVLHDFETDEATKRLLTEHTLYVVPRISADGAELFLTTPTDEVRSSTALWPYLKEPEGLVQKDIDGDGEIVLMRIEDPSGPFRVSEKDPRIMVARRPDEDAGTGAKFYHLMSEGEFHDWDGFSRKFPHRMGHDLNRNFPADWSPEKEQFGAGPYALSQPETQAIAKAIGDRPNILGLQNYHTFSGVILRPGIRHKDDDMDQIDLRAFKALGNRGEELTGYKCISIFHDFKYHPQHNITGTMLDWAYEQRGILAYVTEIWGIDQMAGLRFDNVAKQFFEGVSEEDHKTILNWCDENLDQGSFFKEWSAFEHPQLGKVEIGGWKQKFTWRNPPLKFLAETTQKNADFSLACARALPRVQITDSKDEVVGTSESGEKIRRLTLVIENTGYQTTYGTERARKAIIANKPRVKLKLSDKQSLLSGKTEFEIDELSGRVHHPIQQTNVFPFFCASENAHQKKFEWLVQGEGSIDFEVKFEKAGVLRHRFS